MEYNLLSFSKLIQFLVWAEENKVDAILVVIMYHNVKKIMGSNVRVSLWSCSIVFHLFAYLQDEWLSCKILQEEWLSCKILASSFRSSSAIIWNKIYTRYLYFITAVDINTGYSHLFTLIRA